MIVGSGASRCLVSGGRPALPFVALLTLFWIAAGSVAQPPLEPSPGVAEQALEDVSPQTTASLLAAGIAVHDDGRPEDALALFQGLAASLEPLVATGGLTPRDIAPPPAAPPASSPFDELRIAYLYLAATHRALDAPAAADEVLDRLIRLDPVFEPDPATVGQQLVDRLHGRRRELVGRVSFVVRPVDATIRVDGSEFVNSAQPETVPGLFVPGFRPGGFRVVDLRMLAERAGSTVEGLHQAPEPAVLLTGEYLAEVARPGYRPALAGFTVAAGEDVEVAVTLKRESATLRLRTAPSDAIVLIDGYERGRTAGAAEPAFIPEGPADWMEQEAFSRELWIDDLPAGRYRLEIRKEGFRGHSASLDAGGLRDNELPPIILDPEEAVVVLKGLPEDADVLANGRLLKPDRQRWPPEALVPPGAHTITVRRGLHGYFETSVTVADGGRAEVDVELRPAVAFLGIFGSDEAGRGAVASGVQVLRDQAAYTVLDRAKQGAALLDEIGVEIPVLRARAESARLELDWKAIQKQVQQRLPASLYLAAVLNDDLVAEAVDLWWWATAPGPARPDVRTVRIESGRLEGAALWRLVNALDASRTRRTPRLGAVLIESLAGEAPIVATVEPGSPAEAAGLRPGMEVISVGGREASPLQLSAALERSGPGGTIELEVLGDQGATTVAVSPELGWTPLDAFDSELLYSAAASRLLRELESAGDIPRWLLELDLAKLLLESGDATAAVGRLEMIDVTGLSETYAEMVQYTLGLALSSLAEAGRDEFRPRARSVFEELASSGQDRLLTMRARLRADALEE